MTEPKTSQAVVETHEANLPAPVARRGIDEYTWRALMTSVYPGAKSESVIMVWDYCKARHLDPLKKVVHIVPMQVTDAKTGNKEWRDVVMPGIAELRTTATRTGVYAGQDEPEFGPQKTHLTVAAPEWCKVTVYRIVQDMRVSFAHTAFFAEECATKDGGNSLNKMWTKRPRGQIAKCAEAGALRKAFPEELGGEYAAEEMEGKEFIEGSAARVDDPSESAERATQGTTQNLKQRIKDIQERGKKPEAPAPEVPVEDPAPGHPGTSEK